MATNYWDPNSGDSQASTWNTSNWADSAQQQAGDPKAGSNGLPTATSYSSMLGNINDMNGDLRYGSFTDALSSGGGGYWSGGRPGAGSWMEAMASAQAAPGNGMIPGATGNPGGGGTLKPGGAPQIGTGSNPGMTTDGTYGSREYKGSGPQDQGQYQDISTFDPQAYLLANPDVARAGMNPWEHWTRYGAGEGRQFSYRQPTAPTNPWINPPQSRNMYGYGQQES